MMAFSRPTRTSDEEELPRKRRKASESSDRVKAFLSKMTLQDKIGQMSQIDLALLMDDNGPDGKKQVSHEKLLHYFGKLGIGSVLNNVGGEHVPAEFYRNVLVQIQQITKDAHRPPVIYGLDSIHGANYVHGAILSPQPINLAATFNITTAHYAGILASRDTRAAGISWLFSPLLGLALEPKWSRVYETFGEDPKLVGDMALAMITGIQQQGEGIPSRAAACAKHFVGYSLPHNGHDRSPSWIPTRHLYQYFVPPWRVALQEALTVMESYTETDGVPNVANSRFLKKLLRQDLEFDGVLVTDYSEILNLHSWHHIARDDDEATMYALHEGSVDMSMIPFDTDGFRSAVIQGMKDKYLGMERIDESVERILRLKEQLGMFDEELTMDDVNLDRVGSGRGEALDMAHQGIVLVQNRNQILPLHPKKSMKILVTGPTSKSLRYQSGGWTGQWQGAPPGADWFAYGTTVAEAMQNTSSTWDVTLSCGVNILGGECKDGDEDQDGDGGVISNVVSTVESWVGMGDDDDDGSIKRAANLASDVDYVVVCVGEEAYTEKPGDIRSLALPEGQYRLLRALKETSKKIILAYFGGRPRLLEDMVEIADAVLVGFLPGPDAGRALVDLLSGKANPSGRLPMTYPKFADGGGSPHFHAVSDQCTSGDGPLPHYDHVFCDVQWPFGHGLSYTTFEYSELRVTPDRLLYSALGQERKHAHNQDTLSISTKVKNMGNHSGSEVVLFFTFDESRQVTPEYKRLRSFEKIHLKPGEEKTVSATISVNDPSFQFVGAHDDSHLVLQNGMRFRVGVGAGTECRNNEGSESDLCSPFVTIDAGDDYVGACDAACRVWADSGCADEFQLSPTQCWQMCTKTTDFAISGMKRNDGWGWNYVNCIESVVWGSSQQVGGLQDQCWKMTALCRNIFATATLNEFGQVPVVKTSPSASIILALFSGLLGTAIMLRGCRSKDSDKKPTFDRRGDDVGDIQFTHLVANGESDFDRHIS